MMTGRTTILASALLASLTALASPVTAQGQESSVLDACLSDRPSLPDGPVQVGLLDGQLGMARRACPRSEIQLGADLYLVAELAEFYGNLRINASMRGSWAVTERTEIFMAFEALRYQTIISSLTAAYLGTGYLSVGALQQLWRGRGLALAYTGRLVLPTTSGLDQSSKPLALDSGVTLAWAAHRTLRVQGALTLAGSLGVSDGPALPRGGVWINAGVDWHPLRWLAIVVELNAGFGYRGPVDVVSLAGGFRFGIGDHFGIELGAVYPFAGAERGLISGALTLSWRFDGQERATDASAQEPDREAPIEEPVVVEEPSEPPEAVEPPETAETSEAAVEPEMPAPPSEGGLDQPPQQPSEPLDAEGETTAPSEVPVQGAEPRP